MNHLRPISVRVAARERKLLETAAEQSRSTLSDFIRRKSIEAAEIELMRRNVVTIPAAEWEKFEAWSRQPPRRVKGLKALAGLMPGWRS
jgi:uncharacterized protein (DUF1778 family)